MLTFPNTGCRVLDLVDHQPLKRRLAVLAIAQVHQANGVIDEGETNGLGEIPLCAITGVTTRLRSSGATPRPTRPPSSHRL